MEYLTLTQTDNSLTVTFETRSISDPLIVKSILNDLVKNVQPTGQRNVTLDFTKVHHISTGMLGALLTFRSHALFHGIELSLSGLNREILNVVTQTGLEGLFQIKGPKHDAAKLAPQLKSRLKATFCLA